MIKWEKFVEMRSSSENDKSHIITAYFSLICAQGQEKELISDSTSLCCILPPYLEEGRRLPASCTLIWAFLHKKQMYNEGEATPPWILTGSSQ